MTMIEESSDFVVRLSRQLAGWNVSAETMGTHFSAFGESYALMSLEVTKFDTLTAGFKTWWSDEASCPVNNMMGSLSKLGGTMENVAIMMNQQNEVQMGSLVQALNEYSTLVKTIPTVHHGAKWREVLLESEAGRSDVATVSIILMAEFRHFHKMLVTDLKMIVETFIHQQVAYHKQLASMWEGLLPSFAA